MLFRGERIERAAAHRLDRVDSAGQSGDPATEGIRPFAPRRGAARLVADSLKTTNAWGVSGTVIQCADSAYFGRPVTSAAPGAARIFDHRPQDPKSDRGDRGHPRARMDPDPLPQGGVDEQLRQWVSDAEVAEIASPP